MKIVFFGTSDFSVLTLRALKNEKHEILAVTSPDKPKGRKNVITESTVKALAGQLDIATLQPEKLRDNKEFLEKLNKFNPDIGVVVAYGKIIPQEIINLPKYGILNIHPSLLPKLRGPSPVQTAILTGEKETGVTIIKIDEEVDHGNILASENYKLPTDIYYEKALLELFKIGTELLIKILPDYLADKIKPQPQDHSRATFTRKFTTEDGEIKPDDTAQTAYNKIRALNPEPGAYVWFSAKGGSASGGKKLRLKILEAGLNDGHLEFKKVQLEGGKPMAMKEFKIGHPNFTNNLL